MAFTGTLTIKNNAGNSTVAVFTPPYIFSAKIHLAESMVGDQLSYDTASFGVTLVTGEGWGGFITTDAGELYTAGEQFLVLADEMMDVPKYPYGYQAVYDDGTSHFVFYVQRITRTGKRDYQIDCISAVGLLSTMQYDGGMWLYTAPTTVQTLLNDILSGSGISFSYDPTYANQRVSGWLPISTKREAIQQVLFAAGLNLIRQHDGTSYVTGLDASTSTQIPDNRVYYGGKVVGKQSVSKVVVVEHDYVNSTETEEIFSGDITEPNTRIVFNKPFHDVTGVDSNGNPVALTAYTNYCIVANVTTGVTITGQTYIDNQTEIEIDLNQSTDKVARVDKAYLINIMNAEGLLNRVAQYYSSAVTVESAVVYEGDELPGDNVTIKDTWDEEVTGLISQMDIVASAVTKANLKVVTDYVPEGSGNLWENAVVLSTNQTWTVPASTSGKIKVIVIGGGNAGQNGYPGEDGQVQSAQELAQLISVFAFDENGYPRHTDWRSPYGQGRGGEGGAGGVHGDGGKIFQATVDVSPGDTLTISIGAGGVASPVVTGGEMGGLGGATTVVHNGVTYTSADGESSPTGFSSYLLPDRHALGLPGLRDGIKGGRSGYDRSDLTYNGYWEKNSGGVETVTDFNGHTFVWGGVNGHWYQSTDSLLNRIRVSALFPACGGGAAVGNNGNPPTPDSIWHDYYGSDDYYYIPGVAGDGATPTRAAFGNYYGEGGCGGHGGGGGGGQGDIIQLNYKNQYQKYTVGEHIRISVGSQVNYEIMSLSAPGHGGNGGQAGDGQYGCVVIYY